MLIDDQELIKRAVAHFKDEVFSSEIVQSTSAILMGQVYALVLFPL